MEWMVLCITCCGIIFFTGLLIMVFILVDYLLDKTMNIFKKIWKGSNNGYDILYPRDSEDKSFDSDSWTLANRIINQDFKGSDRIFYLVDLRRIRFNELELEKILKKYTRLNFVINQHRSSDIIKELTIFLDTKE